MKAAVYYQAKDIRIEDVNDPKLQDDSIIIQIKAAGICGTDVHRWNVKGLTEMPTEAGRIMGHEFCGDVVEVGAKVQHIRTNDRIVAIGNGAFAERVSIPNAILDCNVFLLPDELSYEQGATIEPLCAATSVVRRAKPAVNDIVVILGLGMLGHCATQVFKTMGISIIIVSEIGKKRLELAKQLGIADVVINAREEDPIKRIREITSEQGADIVAECAGVPATFLQAVEIVRQGCFKPAQGIIRDGGKIIIPAIYEQPIQWLPNRMIFGNIMIIGMMGGGVPSQVGFAQAINLLKTGMVDTQSLITHEFPLNKITEAFETASKTDESIKVLVKP